MSKVEVGVSDFIAPASLYVHVPLCASKCSYCDFYSVPSPANAEACESALVGAILDRASTLSRRFGAERFDTVYVGGGTPSILSAVALDRLLAGLETLAIGASAQRPREWTVEANPDSICPEKLELMKAHGVTRVSIGVQSLDPEELALLGRRHNPDSALGAVRRAAEAGMAVSADLIAGIPALPQSRRDFADADRLAGFSRELQDAGAAHLSIYDLTIEEGTPLAARRAHLRFPDEDEDWETRQKLEASLAKSGLRRYEVSNYSAVGDECRHNLAYWHMDSYIGAGPGAVSTLVHRSGTALRIEEARIIEDYGLLSSGAALETVIGLKDAFFESIMMAFRSSFGLDLAVFRRRFGLDASAIIGSSLSNWGSHVVRGEPWPWMDSSGGPALDGSGLDLLNRFLIDCLEEIERNLPLLRQIEAEKRTVIRKEGNS